MRSRYLEALPGSCAFAHIATMAHICYTHAHTLPFLCFTPLSHTVQHGVQHEVQHGHDSRRELLVHCFGNDSLLYQLTGMSTSGKKVHILPYISPTHHALPATKEESREIEVNNLSLNASLPDSRHWFANLPYVN